MSSTPLDELRECFEKYKDANLRVSNAFHAWRNGYSTLALLEDNICHCPEESRGQVTTEMEDIKADVGKLDLQLRVARRVKHEKIVDIIQ